MRIVYGQRTISLTWLPVALYFLLVLFPMELGQTLLHGPASEATEPVEGPRKIITGIALVITLARFKRLPPFLRNLFYIAFAYICVLALESYYTYGTFFVYPHVFGKFFVLFSCMAVYIAFRNAQEWAFTAALLLMMAIFMTDILVYYPDVLSIGSFMNIERGLHATNVFFLMCVWLYAFNSYLPTLKVQWLVVFFVAAGFILFLNHRTVWLASITSFAVNLFLVNLRGKERYSPTAFTPIIVIPVIAAMLVFAYVFSEKPEFLQNIMDRILDIQKVDEQGTGKWRLEQFESYLPFVLEHPLFGMRFEGFELPVQFFAEQTGKEVFDAQTGHHFHSFYMDSLFYHGLLGLCILASVFVYTFRKLLLFPVQPPLRIVGLGVWCIFCLQYGLSYPMDDFHFAMAGFSLAAMDTYLEKVQAELQLQEAVAYEGEVEPEQEEEVLNAEAQAE